MQNKGALKLLVVALTIASAYALSFTFVSQRVEKKADVYAEQFDVDIRDSMRYDYLERKKADVIYNLGFVKFTYKDVKEKEINLGLDLKGGMNVLLEISPEDIVRALSGNNQDPVFIEAMAKASVESKKATSGSFVSNFTRAYEQLSGGAMLIDIFGTPDMIQGKTLAMDATNQQVAEYLQKEVDSATENSFNILAKRIDKFGVTQPNIQRVGTSGRILVELPGIKEPGRVRNLLQGAASLEFWMTYDNARIVPLFSQVDAVLREIAKNNTNDLPAEDGAEVAGDVPSQELAEAPAVAEGEDSGLISQITADEEEVAADVNVIDKERYPFTSLLRQSIVLDEQNAFYLRSPAVGLAFASDIPAINAALEKPEVKLLFPSDLKLMWGVKGINKGENIFELYAIRDRSGKGVAELDGRAVENATGDYEEHGSGGRVSMVMNREGADVWERMTRDAIDKNNLDAGFSRSIAIVLDNYVYSAPGVNEVISGGQSSITGNFTIQEAKDLANVLKSGKLPAPARIVQDTVVGPSLGQETIQSSMISFVLAFLLVLLYMVFFYNKAGWVASVALIANLFFLFGVLVSFGFVLTLPGIAGIVLTIGMAVDANVIIYERIKEELRAGKALSAAISAGYKNAMSAIIDSNLTSIITGVILVWFGTGPVQGFATTLIIGIITSLFCSIFITRLLFTGMLSRGKNITFSNKLTHNFLSNTKVDFLSIRKIAYAVSLLLIVVSTVSLFTRKLNPGVDFTGGRSYVVRFDQPVTAEQVRSALDDGFSQAEGDATQKSFEVKQFGNESQMQMRIVTQYMAGNESAEASSIVEGLLYGALEPLYADRLTQQEFATTATNPHGIISIDTVGASVAHGILINSFYAVAMGLLGIGLYVIMRFKRWQYGVGSVVALTHDAFLTVGLFSLLHGILPFNMEINQSFIAAILTIIGYSINDKVVIFDRIREYQTLYPKRSIKENVNNAINSTLSRTINTSGTTFVTLLAIFLFGGEVIRGFVFALLFGVIVITLSSIFIATPISYDLMKKASRDKGAK